MSEILQELGQHIARAKGVSGFNIAYGELNIAAEVLATRRELEGIARGRDADVLHGWRRQALGEELLAATAAS